MIQGSERAFLIEKIARKICEIEDIKPWEETTLSAQHWYLGFASGSLKAIEDAEYVILERRLFMSREDFDAALDASLPAPAEPMENEPE